MHGRFAKPFSLSAILIIYVAGRGSLVVRNFFLWSKNEVIVVTHNEKNQTWDCLFSRPNLNTKTIEKV